MKPGSCRFPEPRILREENLKPLMLFVRLADGLNDRVGKAVAWLMIPMVLITFSVAVLRYAFSIGWVWMQESYVWLHGIVFMLGAGYTLLHGGHVRVDIFYRPASHRYRAWVDLAGSICFLLPVMAIVAYFSWNYVADSWMRLEASREAGGLEGLFLYKSVIIVFCVLLGVQALSVAARSVLSITGHDAFIPAQEEHEPV